VNVAGNATASVSATTSWNRATGINDGVATFPVAVQSTAWGTFGLTGETQWAQLTWDEPVTVGTSRLLFFDDGGGMDLPASYKLEYLDGEAWVEVPEPSGYTTTLGEFDVVTHGAVTTTALRATLTKPASAYVGIVEWQVLDVPAAPDPVLEVPTGPVTAGAGFPVTLTDGEADAEYAVTLEPGGFDLGTLTTDADGAGVLHTAALPIDLAAGEYTVRAAHGDAVVEATVTVEEADVPDEVVPGTVTITGSPEVGGELTAETASWEPEGVSFAYQWFVGGSIVDGADQATFAPRAEDLGKTVVARVTGFADGMLSASAESDPVGPVTLPKLQAGEVSIDDTPGAGRKLRAEVSGWPEAARLEYRWRVDGVLASGAKKDTFSPRGRDAGKTVVVEVRATRTGYEPTPWVASDPVTIPRKH
jgi:hypothetical protein